MQATIRIKLTDAQVGAVQCRDWSEEPHMQKAWDGGDVLVFSECDRAMLASEVNDASNAEDEHAQVLDREDVECAKLARRSARVLCNLYLRILNA